MPKIFVCGDILNRFSDRPFVSTKLQQLIKDCDYAVCNFEGVALDNAFSQTKGLIQHPSTLSHLREAGFDLLLLANNHITDVGEDGVRQTIEKSRNLGFNTLGAGLFFRDAYQPLVFEKDGICIGILNLCEAHPGYFKDENQAYGYAWLGHPSLPYMIRSLKKRVDRLFIFVHAGLEHYDLPLEEFRVLYRRYCDLGADCVIGSHPHIAQGIENYNDNLIVYSLGNFFFPRCSSASSDDIENQSYSLVLNLGISGKIDYQVRYHGVDNLCVDVLTENRKINVGDLSSRLLSPVYEHEIRKVNIQAYEGLVYRLYREALMGTSHTDTVWDSFKFIVCYLFCRKGRYLQTRHYREKLLLHLTTNETYRFLTQAALRLKLEQ